MNEQSQWIELMKEVIRTTEGSSDADMFEVIELMKERLQGSIVTSR
ncbi:hypothetical protein [Pontibacillus salipaludis]|uniref:Uncharacterized protein n=1 Tax=Pontibacillus salipaludis TaxID=1697394 RepID=A0ABQ1Q2Q2_9BACI|nr:hypothetical protein [Pontibacillus salipaludis]GGD10397.1 hypothetical protein GCM10011389_17470 [Pontibacillus salipaludis]